MTRELIRVRKRGQGLVGSLVFLNFAANLTLMIQRIQTIFFILAAVANVAVLFLPLGAASNNDSMEGVTVELSGMSIKTTGLDEATADFVEKSIGFSDDTLLMVHVLLVALTSLYLIILIFLYGDRPRQIKMSYVGILLLMGQVLVAILLFMQLPEMAGNPEDLRHDVAYGLFIPVIALLFTWLAIGRIKKDERLIRDSNRLR